MIRVEKLIPGGQAIATTKEGKKIFFWNALPGEIVLEYQTTKNKTHYEEAIATKISDFSPFRKEPKDSCYLATSPWQILNYDYELKQKQALIVEAFREQHIIIDSPAIFTDHKEYFYRNKMEYALYWNHETNRIDLAFHERGSHRKFPIQKSSIERPEIFNAATKIIADLNSKNEEARKYQSLLLRCNQDGEVSGGLFENNKSHPKFYNLTDTILGSTYSYSPNGFFQINLPVYEMALREIKNHISTDQVLDLYAGVGTIGLSVARERHLTLVECNQSAFSEMAKNITAKNHPEISNLNKNNSIRNGDILGLLSKSEEALNHIVQNQTVILDPPRAGCDEKLINKLLKIEPTKIIYLSCNPITQARDVKKLLDKYQIDSISTFNFFPHTPHIENLVVLSR